jgi:hypothetical protein
MIVWRDGEHLALGKVVAFVLVGAAKLASVNLFVQSGNEYRDAQDVRLVDLGDVLQAVIYYQHENGSVTPCVSEYF